MPLSPASSPIEKARVQALRLLKFRSRSEAELRIRLGHSGFSSSVVEELLTEFKEKKLLDDAKFAQLFATYRLEAKPMGRRGLLESLRLKGVSGNQATQAVEQAFEEKTELEMAREAASTRVSHMKGLSPQVVQRRLFGFLGRRGFSTDVIYRVVREISSRSAAG